MSADPSGFTAVTTLLSQRARHQPDRTPLSVDGKTWLSFGEWDARSNAVAHGLLDRGLRRGDRVGLFFTGMDWFDYVVAYFGVLKAGGTATHLTDLLDPADLRRRLDQATATAVIYGAGLQAPEFFGGWSTTTRGIETSDTSPVPVEITPEDICDILYTSGTTGPAKPLLNPHGNLSFGRGWSALAEDIFDQTRPLLSPLPIGTAYSASTAGAFAVATNAPVIVSETHDTERMGQLVEQHRIGSVMVRPRVAMRFVHTNLGKRYDLTSVTVLGVASGQLPPRYGRQLLAMMPNAMISTAYGGGSEAVPAHIRATYDPARPGCMGRAQPGTDLRIADKTGFELPTGLVGEIWLRTAAPRRRYLDLAAEAKVFVDGWVRTGDLGRVTEDGELHFFDRGEDSIRTASGLVSSVEVENALYEHEAVDEVAVIGVTGIDGFQRIVAAITLVPRPRAGRLRALLRRLTGRRRPAAPAKPDFTDLLVSRLPTHAWPTRVEVMETLPRSPISDKILKVRLRERFSAPRRAA